MSRVISCEVVSSETAAIMRADSFEPHAAALAQPGDQPQRFRRRLAPAQGCNCRTPSEARIMDRPRYDRRRDIPLGLVLDFLA